MLSVKNVGDLRRTAIALLTGASDDRRTDIDNPYFEADALIGHVLSLSRANLHAYPEKEISPGAVARVVELAVRRAAGEPLAHLLGDALFSGRSFQIDRRVLIPRTETEFLVREADAFLKSFQHPGYFADWCTGSGCIAVTLLADNPEWRAFAADSSLEALDIARKNAIQHQVQDRLELLDCDDPSAIDTQIPDDSLAMIVANPPYIPTGEIATLEAQVRHYEPREALDGGTDGLLIYRLLLRTLPRFLHAGGLLLLETGGEKQVEQIRAIVAELTETLTFAGVFADHRGIVRFIRWRKNA